MKLKKNKMETLLISKPIIEKKTKSTPKVHEENPKLRQLSKNIIDIKSIEINTNIKTKSTTKSNTRLNKDLLQAQNILHRAFFISFLFFTTIATSL